MAMIEYLLKKSGGGCTCPRPCISARKVYPVLVELTAVTMSELTTLECSAQRHEGPDNTSSTTTCRTRASTPLKARMSTPLAANKSYSRGSSPIFQQHFGVNIDRSSR